MEYYVGAKNKQFHNLMWRDFWDFQDLSEKGKVQKKDIEATLCVRQKGR